MAPTITCISPVKQALNSGAAEWTYPAGAGPSFSSAYSVAPVSFTVSGAFVTPGQCGGAASFLAAPLQNTPPADIRQVCGL